MESHATPARADEADGLLFDSWFDPIEDGLRAKVRGSRNSGHNDPPLRCPDLDVLRCRGATPSSSRRAPPAEKRPIGVNAHGLPKENGFPSSQPSKSVSSSVASRPGLFAPGP